MIRSAPNRLLPWLLGGLLVLVCAAIYRDVISFGFVGLDDDYNIIFNPHLGPPTLARVRWAFTDWEYARRYLPLGWLGFSVVNDFSGLSPAGYHAAALGWHLLNGLLVAAVLARFTDRELGADVSPWRVLVVFGGAALWMWHPLRVESVAWASGLLYEQSTFFMLVALGLQLAERRAWAVASYALALLTYPSALSLWPVFILLDARREGWRRAWTRNLGHTIAAGALGAVTLLGRLLVTGNWPAAPSIADFSIAQRVLQSLYVQTHYLIRPWVPIALSPVDPVALNLAHPAGRMLLGAALTLGFGLWLLVSRRARAAVGWLALAHVLVLMPVLGVVERPYIPADRYAFLPQLIWTSALVLLLARLAAHRVLASLGLAASLVACAGLTHAQLAIWRDEPALWRHIASTVTVQQLPVVACARPALSRLRSGDRDAAFALIDAGLRALPDDAMLRATRDEMLKIDRDNRARAAALGLATPLPPAAELHHALAISFARAGETEAAAQHLAEVARLAPEYFSRVTRRPSP